jgi:predicted peptidase
MKITAYTKVADQGWTVTAFEVYPASAAGKSPSDFSISVEEWGAVRENASKVLSVTEVANGVRLEVEPFGFRKFAVKGSGASAEISFGRENVTDVKTEWADLFEARNDNGVYYRLYTPAAAGARPLVLFLHGEGGVRFVVAADHFAESGHDDRRSARLRLRLGVGREAG